MKIDHHVHTCFSDGENTAAQVIDEAVRLGITSLAITDHCDPFDPSWAHLGASPAALARHFEAIRAYAAGKPLRVICGVETSTDQYGRLRLPRQVLALCEVVITSVHYLEDAPPVRRGVYDNDAYWQAYRQKLLAQAAGPGHILGHPEGYLPIGPMLAPGTTFADRLAICARISRRYFDEAFIDALGDALAASGKAYELHDASGTPRAWVIRRLQAKGVRFSIGSDAHSLDRLGCNDRALRLAEKWGLSLLTFSRGPAEKSGNAQSWGPPLTGASQGDDL